MLSLADRSGMRVYLGSLQTATDWTDGTEFAAWRAHNRRVATRSHSMLRPPFFCAGLAFSQGIWMNSVKEYGAYYDGTELLANWATDMKDIDPGRKTLATL